MIATNKPKPVIYLAGKIASLDWRHQVFGPHFGSTDSVYDELFNEALTHDMGRFLYGGPFFISCDHCCSHGPATHGAGPGCGSGDNQVGKLEMRERILELNFARIQRADYILAYINESDCFGTLIEIGYAFAINKKIAIGIGPNITAAQFDDLWMARDCHTAGGLEVWPGEPKKVFNRFLEWVMAQQAARDRLALVS